MADVVRTITVRGTSEGLDDVTAKLKGLQSAYQSVNDTAQKSNSADGLFGGSLTATSDGAKQLQDVLRGLAGSVKSDGNPLAVLKEQGLSLAKTFASGPGGLAGAFSAFGTSLMELASNPLTVLPIALTAVAGGVKLLIDEMDANGVNAFNDTMKDSADVLQRVKASYDDAAIVARNFAGIGSAGLQVDLMRQIKDQADMIERQNEFSNAGFSPSQFIRPGGLQQLTQGDPNFANLDAVLSKLAPIQDQIAKFREELDAGTASWMKFRDAMAQLKIDGPTEEIRKAADAAFDLSKKSADAEDRQNHLNAQLHVIQGTATETERAMLGLARSAKDYADALTNIPQTAFNDAMRTALQNIPALSEAMKHQAIAEQAQKAIDAAIGYGPRTIEQQNQADRILDAFRDATPYITGAAQALKSATEAVDDFVAKVNQASLRPAQQQIASLQEAYDKMARSLKEQAVLHPSDAAGINAGLSTAQAALNQQIAGIRDYSVPLRALTDEVAHQAMEVDIQAQSFGKTAGAAVTYRYQQEQIFAVMKSGVDVTQALRDKIATLATAYGQAAQASENLKLAQQSASTASNYLFSALDGVMNQGQSFSQSLSNVFKQMSSDSLRFAVTGTGPQASFYGAQGAAYGQQGGIMGAMFPSAFGITQASSAASAAAASAGLSSVATSAAAASAALSRIGMAGLGGLPAVTPPGGAGGFGTAPITPVTSSPLGPIGAGGAVNMSAAAMAIRSMESGSSAGNYGAVGPVTASGDHAYGAYQVMGANVPAWTQQYYGTSLTSQQFLANKAAQDAVFQGQFGSYASQYGAAGASRAWFTGSPTGTGADVNGTTGPAYQSQFSALYGRYNTGIGSAQPMANSFTVPAPGTSLPMITGMGTAGTSIGSTGIGASMGSAFSAAGGMGAMATSMLPMLLTPMILMGLSSLFSDTPSTPKPNRPNRFNADERDDMGMTTYRRGTQQVNHITIAGEVSKESVDRLAKGLKDLHDSIEPRAGKVASSIISRVQRDRLHLARN
jgi:hypothetical protein